MDERALAELVSEYRDAAGRWFAGNAGPARFRAWVDGDRAAQRATWDAFEAFGFGEAIAATPDEDARAAIVAAVGREAGRHLYPGPLVETLAGPLLGIVHGGARVIRVRGLLSARAAPPVARADRAQPITPAPHAGLADAVCATDGGVAARLWEIGPGRKVDVRPVRDADGTEVGVALLSMPLPLPHAVPAPPRAALEHYDELDRLAHAARLVGVAERVAELAREHLLLRRQFGRPLAAFQALQHQAVDRHLEVTLAASLLGRVLAEWSRTESRRALLHALKACAADTALAAAKTAVQHFGAMGFAHEGDAGLYLRHAVALAARGGDALAHRRRFGERIGSLLD